jgi:hypothetical protein
MNHKTLLSELEFYGVLGLMHKLLASHINRKISEDKITR